MTAFFSKENALASGSQISYTGSVEPGYPASQVYDSSPVMQWRPIAGSHSIVHRLATGSSTVKIAGFGFQMLAATAGTVTIATALSQGGTWTNIAENLTLERCVFRAVPETDVRYIRFTFTNLPTGGATFTHIWAGEVIETRTPAPHKTLGTGFADFYEIRGRRAIDGGIFDTRSYYRGQRTQINLQETPAWVSENLVELRARLLTLGAYFAWNMESHPEQVGYVRTHNPPMMPKQTAGGTLVIGLSLEAP